MISLVLALALTSSALAAPLPCDNCHILRPGVLPLQGRGAFNIDEAHTSLLDSYVYALDAPLSSLSLPLETASSPYFPTSLSALNTAVPTATLTLVVDPSALSFAATSYPTYGMKADSLSQDKLLKDFFGALSNSNSASLQLPTASHTPNTSALDMPCMPTPTPYVHQNLVNAQNATEDFSSSLIVVYSSTTSTSSASISSMGGSSTPTTSATATAESLNGANDIFKHFIGALSAFASPGTCCTTSPMSQSSTAGSTGKDRAGMDSDDLALANAQAPASEVTVTTTVTETADSSAATNTAPPDDVAALTSSAPAF